MWLLAAIAAASCGGGDSDSARRDDALVVVLPVDPEQLDPRLVADAYGIKLTRLIFASLITIDPRTLEVIPDLAEAVVPTSPTRFVARLRSGLRFSDGSALDAADVVATFRSVIEASVGARYAETYRRIARMETIDSRTVVFHLTEPHATFLTDLELPVMRSEDARHVVGAPGGAPAIGAGPYRLVERGLGRLELAPNPHWHRGRPLYPRVRMIVVRDDNTRALRLLAGRADLALNAVPPVLLPLFTHDSRFRVRSVAGVGTTYLGFNMESRAVDDLRVRRAIAHAIDREALVRAKLHGRARLARGWIPPGHWAYAEGVATYGYDPARARALLDDAGLRDPDGAGPLPRAHLTLRTSTDRFRQSIARAIAAMLGEIGLDVDVRPSELASLLDDLNRGRFELATLQVPEVFEPNVLSWFFGSDHIPGEHEGSNRWRFRDAALDAALTRGRRTVVREERRAAYDEVQRILADELPVVPLWHEDSVAITSARASRYDVPRDGRFGTLAR